MPPPQHSPLSHHDPDWFTATHWSVVLTAAQDTSQASTEALEKLCRTYWYPLYSFVRRRGFDVPEAEDLTQEFFASLFEKNSFSQADPARGKFRSFLLASLNHFLCNQGDKNRAEKRGGRYSFVSLDEDSAEKRYLSEPLSELSPEKVFDKRWAWTVLEQTYALLRRDFEAAGKAQQLDLLKRFLAAEGGSTDYAAVGAELKMTAKHVAVAVHRMRHKYREFARAVIAQTVSSPGEIDEEMRYLVEILRQ